MHPAFSPVTLHRSWWDGPEPVNGDVLRTKSGRRYLITAVRGKRLDCIVLDATAQVQGTVFDWWWSKRTAAGKGQRR